MKKREFLLTLAAIAVLGVSGCGNKELTLVSNQVEVELGTELDTTVTNYVELDEKAAGDAAIDFSAVDVMTVGTYTANVNYKEQTASFEVIVVDTTAPEVTVTEQAVVAAGKPLYAEDVITGITELSGSVEAVFQEPESLDEETEVVGEPAEQIEGTEIAGEPTEQVESTEAAEESTEQIEDTEVAELAVESFMLDDVICSNDSVTYEGVGEYDSILTVTDASGNSTEVTVHIVVGDAPELSGVEDITVTAGTESVDYLDGVTAKDSNGNDITANIICDSAAVKLETAGEYEITYTVADANGFTATQTAAVTVEEKNGKTSDGKKEDSRTDTSKKNNSSSSGNSKDASTGSSSENSASGNGNTSGSNQESGSENTSGNAGADHTSSGSNNDTSGSDTGASGSNNTSSTNTETSGSTDNSNQTATQTPAPTPAPSESAPSTDTGNVSTPSTDNGNVSTPSTDTGSNSNGGMAVPDDALNDPVFDPSTNPEKTDELGGSGEYDIENQ